jgi:hypothetical protein
VAEVVAALLPHLFFGIAWNVTYFRLRRREAVGRASGPDPVPAAAAAPV